MLENTAKLSYTIKNYKFGGGSMHSTVNAHKLWYKKPATIWNEALPVGNGRIGGMIYGKAKNETVELNEDTLWSGLPHMASGEYSEIYKKAQALALEENFAEARKLLEEEFGENLVQMYLPLGSLNITMNHGEEITNYYRELRLDTATHTVSYIADGKKYVRTTVVSEKDNVMAVNIKSENNTVSFSVRLTGALLCEESNNNFACYIEGNAPVCVAKEKDHTGHPECKIYGKTDLEKGIGYKAGITVQNNGGTVTFKNNVITVENAKTATVYFAVRTSFNGPFNHPVLNGKEYKNACENDLVQAKSKSFEKILNNTVKSHQALYNKTELDLGESKISNLPTDERLILHKNGEPDNALYALVFHFGRYLTISASRKGTQPMNLQGIWNAELIPPWSSNYTLNINTEMNYWPTLASGLEECYEPLIRFVKELHYAGTKTAKQFYGVNGFVSHHSSDLWRTTHPSTNKMEGNCQWGFWGMSSGWLCEMVMNYFRHTQNKDFLKEFYPVLKDSALFYKSLLIEKDGYMIICPSTSPENNFMLNEHLESPLDITATMTTTIVRDVFNSVIEAGELLGEDVFQYKQLINKLQPYSVAKDGTLNEWYKERAVWEEHHRHVSHLYGLFPSNQIKTQELKQACKQTLEKRGDESSGWSIAWKINLWARLGEGDRVIKLLDMFLKPVDSNAERSCKGGVYTSMLCAHPPFQIDGNFGACNGILEMLVNNSEKELKLLPALPTSWKNGKLYGYALSLNKAMDIEWKNGKIVSKKEYNRV